jgi:hypothetical protein
MHKGFKCLGPAEGRIYISRDVVFDESIFLFSSLRPNAGARLRGEIALLSHSLLSANASFGDAFLRDQYTSPPVSSNPLPSAVDHTGNTKKIGSKTVAFLSFSGIISCPHMATSRAQDTRAICLLLIPTDPPRIT